MDPLQIASLTTALAPLATRTLSGLVDAVTPDNSFHQVLTRSTNPSSPGSADSAGDPDSSFQALYEDLQKALEQVLKQFPGIKDSVELEVDSQGRFHVHTSNHSASRELEQWLNQNHDLNELAARTVEAKEQWQWNSGSSMSTNSRVHLRISPDR